MRESQLATRREFLIQTLKQSGQLVIASSAIYSISLIQGKGAFGNLAAGAKACPSDGYFCHFLRGYPDGTNQYNWGWESYGPAPACTRTRVVNGGGRVIDCPSPYDTGVID